MDKKSLVRLGGALFFASFLCLTMPVRGESGDEYSRPRQKWGEDKQHKFDKLIKKLNLSEVQVTQLKAHKQAKIKSRERLYLEMDEQKRALKEELENPESDKAKIKQIADYMKQIQSEMVDERINGILEIKAILTPEQYVQFQEKMGRYKEKKIQGYKSKKSSDAWHCNLD